MEEETLESPSPLSSPREELLKRSPPESMKDDVEDEDKSSPDSISKPKSSLRLRSKGRKQSASPQSGGGGDCESRTSQFSTTSSSCGYRESFGKNSKF